jgi:uncharacterized protein (UPF0297 family)
MPRIGAMEYVNIWGYARIIVGQKYHYFRELMYNHINKECGFLISRNWRAYVKKHYCINAAVST